jgi:tetratricopeptide (TPR) repeat protein
LFEKVGDKDGAVRIRIGIGSLYQSIGEFEKALLWYNKALRDASKEENARIQVRVGEMYLSRSKPLDALHRYEDALPLIRSSGNPSLEGTVLAGIGRCYMALDSYRASPETQVS